MLTGSTQILMVSEEYQGQRLDVFLTNSIPDLSRSRLQALIEEGHVHIMPNRKISSSMKIRLHDEISVFLPPPIEATPQPKQIDLDIVYEDDDLLVINKPAGMVVHPAPGHSEDTLVNALLAHCGDSLSGIGGVKRPGIVHRLDKDTSGLMVVAKNDHSHHQLTSQFSDRSLSRVYAALVWGVLDPKSGKISAPIGRHPRNRQKMAVVSRGSREAITFYQSIKQFGDGELQHRISLIECKLATGRTHQIRVHMHHLGHPLLGDPLYGRLPKGIQKKWPEAVFQFHRQALHAKKIQFIHPTTGETCAFEVDLPKDMRDLLAQIQFG